MTTSCKPASWAESEWGYAPWGGDLTASPGGPIPTVFPYTTYCVGSCGPMTVFDTYDEVTENFGMGQAGISYPEEDFQIVSGGAFADSTTAWMFISHSTTPTYTLEVTFRAGDLPPDFSSLITRHFFFGVSSSNDISAGFFFSQAGIAYTGGVKHDGSNNLYLIAPLQILPSSLGLVPLNTYVTLRVVVDGTTNTTYVYLTESQLIPTSGHQLKFVLPSISAGMHTETPNTGTTISIKGTVTNPSALDLDSICLGPSIIAPNLLPVAVVGRDQNIRTCTILQLDGTGSFDPEGTPVTFQWRMTDAPETSTYCSLAHDGITHSPPSPFTNKLHSAEFSTNERIEVGDILLMQGVSYDIVATGTDGDGFYVEVDGYALPSGFSQIPVRILHQSGISGRLTAKPTFFPDVQGLYRFSLVVFDGQLHSLPAETIANVVESAVPRGCIPELGFVWSYLSNFWEMVENTEQVTTFWQGLAQITATELLTLWQHDYGKSLRDIPRAFQRRWLHYDNFIKEPFPALTETKTIFGVVYSEKALNFAGLGSTIHVEFHGQEYIIQLTGTSNTLYEIGIQLERRLRELHDDFRVTCEEPSAGSNTQLLVRAPFRFSFVSGSCTLFTYPQSNTSTLQGTGAAVGINTYKIDRTLSTTEVTQGDFLIIDGVSYRIQKVLSNAVDEFHSMRLLVEGLPLDVGNSWQITRGTTSSYVDFYNALVSPGDIAFFNVSHPNSADTEVIPVTVWGAYTQGERTYLLTDIDPIADALTDGYEVHLDAIFRKTHIPIDPLVLEIPYLQEKIHNTDDTQVLRMNVDFFLEEFRNQRCIRFVSNPEPGADVWEYGLPPQRMWAETTYLDNRPKIEENFGLAVDFKLSDLSQLSDNLDYLSAVRGLWYTYFRGPTIQNLRVGTQILLGLPFAEEAGKIVEIREDFSPTQGRILIQDFGDTGIVRSYAYPRVLGLETNPETNTLYTVGDSVEQFSPLVSGAEVVDYVKQPDWFVGYVQQGAFSEVDKLFRFLVRIDSAAFSLSTLVFVNNFIKRVKPTYTYPFFVVTQKSDDITIEVQDEIHYELSLSLADTVCSWFKSASTGFDDNDTPSQFDGGAPIIDQNLHPLTYPNSQPTPWGYDKDNLCPVDYIVGEVCTTYPVNAPPVFDSVFAWDTGVFTSEFMQAGIANLFVYLNEGVSLSPIKNVVGSFTLDTVKLILDTAFPDVPRNLYLLIKISGVLSAPIPFTTTAGEHYETMLALPSPISVINGDTVEMLIACQGAEPEAVPWATVTVKAGALYKWAYDTNVPAGTYCAHKLL